MIAYFIGGSWDLTKRHMQQCPPVFEITTAPRMPLPKQGYSPAEMDALATVELERELYARARHDHEGEIAIYIFEER